jgi:CDP-glucose 4,6-dehydratase
MVKTDQKFEFAPASFYKGKRVLVTGHTGFKGSWLTLWLHRLGAHVFGFSLPPNQTPNLFELADIEKLCESTMGDIRHADDVRRFIKENPPEIVFHLAAQPLVRASYRAPLETFATNVQGTANVLEALRHTNSARVVVCVTTDKVYRNREWIWPYREEDALGGHDPYSASKAAAELVVSSYRDSFFHEQGVALASARAGNVIGGGDWSEDRLIPDAIRAWECGELLQVRRPDSVRPWQHVVEPVHAYLHLAGQLHKSPELAGAYNFGPDPSSSATVREVVELAASSYPGAQVNFSEENRGPHEAGLLNLDISRAREVLGWNPRWTLQEGIRRTCEWYRQLRDGENAATLCEQDIEEYVHEL